MPLSNPSSAPSSCPSPRRLTAACGLGLVGAFLILLVLWSPEVMPDHRQADLRENVDCGPRSLEIVLRHHGLETDPHELNRCAGLNSGGSSMLGLRDCARSHGMDAQGWQLTAADLPSLPLPAIVFLEDRHFAVLEAIKGDEVRLQDPATGTRTLPLPKFLRRWKGKTLVVQPLIR